MTTWVIKIGTSLLRGNENIQLLISLIIIVHISKAQRNGDKVILEQWCCRTWMS